MTRPAPPPIVAPGQSSTLIIQGSPLALIGIFVTILRQRFTPPDNPMNYIWNNDPNVSTIHIESAFEDDKAVRGKKPGIYVDKEQTLYGRNIIGDRAGHTLHDSKDFQWCLATVPILIECVSARRAESAIIGDVTQWTLHAMSDVIQKTFAFHDMSPITLNRTVPYEDDKEAWSTAISFSVQYNVRWTVLPIAPLLQEVVLQLNRTDISTDDFFLQLLSRNLETLS